MTTYDNLRFILYKVEILFTLDGDRIIECDLYNIEQVFSNWKILVPNKSYLPS